MGATISWRQEPEAEGVRLKMFGDITELADLSPLLEIDVPTVVLDLEGVSRINSSGVRQWTNFIADLSGRGRRIIFDRCSEAIVHQLNMVSNFRGRAQIRSVYAPYVCTACGKPDTKLMQVESAVSLAPEPFPCPTCGSPMEFDDLPEVYFSFHAALGSGLP